MWLIAVAIVVGLWGAGICIGGGIAVLGQRLEGVEKRHREAVELMDLASKALVEAHQTLAQVSAENKRLLAELGDEQRQTYEAIRRMMHAWLAGQSPSRPA